MKSSNDTYSDILNTIQTKQEADAFAYALDKLSDSLFINKADSFEISLQTIISSRQARFLRHIIQKALGDQPNPQQISEVLASLKENVINYKTLSLTTAIDPTEHTINLAVGWANIHLGENVVIDLKKDPGLIAGAIVEFGGIYKDLSIKKRIEEVLRKKQTEIASILK